MSVCRYTCDVNRGPIPMSYDTIPDKISTHYCPVNDSRAGGN